jgi:hypothetical protein
MRKMLDMEKEEIGNHFDLLRKNYPLRREFSNYTLVLSEELKDLKTILEAFRFNVITR